MLLAVINDTHFGVKNASDVFLNHQKKFFTDTFFPYCIKNDIKKIIHLGDFYEHRKYINVKVLSQTREFFVQALRDNDMTMDIIPGNHDTYYKSTNDLCSLGESLDYAKDVIHIHMKPTVKDYDGLKIGLLPWITAENYVESLNFIQTAPTEILAGHLELQGFEMMKGAPVMSHGLESNIFARFDKVMTGHYHTKSTRGNIHYFGTQYELTWSDCNDPKFFHTFDTATRKINPIRNKHTLFNKIVYNNDPEIKLPSLKGTFVKILIASKKDTAKFDSFFNRIQSKNPFDIKIIDSYEEFSGGSVEDDSLSLEDTHSLLNSYVDATETYLDKERIKTRLQTLYNEALLVDGI